MIFVFGLMLAASQVQVVGARSVTDADRVSARDIALRCDFQINNKQTSVIFALNGEIAGVGDGPLALMSSQGSSVKKFRSLPGMISWDESQPAKGRSLDVRLANKLKMDTANFIATINFRYQQNDMTPNLLDRSERVSEARLALFRSSDMKSSAVGYVEKNRDVRSLIETTCMALPTSEATNGIAQ